MGGNFNYKNNKKIILKLTVVVSVIFLIFIFIFGLSKLENNNIELGKQEELIPNKVLQNQLLADFQNGEITTDEYVKYNIYGKYDKSMLDDKYSTIPDFGNIETLIRKYHNELSDETLKYYVEKVNLNNVTFELDKENISSEGKDDNKIGLSNFFVSKVYAKSDKVTNLNKAVLSSEGNFIVWYTTTGDSASDYNSAKKIADGLEETVEKYDDKFGSEYSYSVNFISKGKKYENQLKILKNSGIDESYLDSAMQVYLVEYEVDSLARYIAGYGILREVLYEFVGGDENGSIAFPYILIKPSSFSDSERLEQLYNHEMFHHYQYYVLAEKLNKEVGEDEYILEATANWASSLITNKTTTKGYLNEWAGSAREFSSDLMSEEWANTYGKDMVGYALFVYLYNYSTTVKEGTSKIIQSIYEDDSLKYLQDNSTVHNRNVIQREILLKNLLQDYTNKNLIVDKDFNSGIVAKQTISDDIDLDNIKISRLGIDYYKLNKENSNFNIYIKIKIDKESTKEVSVYLLLEKDNILDVVESFDFSTLREGEPLLGTINPIDYDNAYLVFVNRSTIEDFDYSFRVDKEDMIGKDARGKYYVREFTEDDSVYRLYINPPEGFVSWDSNLLANMGFIKQINNEEVWIVYSLNETSEYYTDLFFEGKKQSFDEDVGAGKYLKAKWFGKRTLLIRDRIVEYSKITYEQGKSGILYSDGKNVYDVVAKDQGDRKAKITAKFEIEEWTIVIDITSYESQNLTDKELLMMAFDATFTIEKE